ncbi:glycoside hydrolase family 32 protein [Deinococcus cellulosilyticus]|uniref:Levanase n=1 Tax=Deinococcus cellulosilyticus (strain DSM 18568 / NBRC 106333 / KACC 11606 / 5516J-15) TaxID=1223518 RepID=A0A511N8D3_DEIC1|nr:glycoside hydrolase family 32 protein [Deinococcus cellulosilyticus]GEM49095.1 hypothetical protein DC3_47300 [Deinococcus cellulosilyticus NBRC 106333 = KACC 11606]
MQSTRTLLLTLGLSAALFSCATTSVTPPPGFPLPRATYDEQWRPQVHFTPQRNWMNDPNGLVYLDGEYHLFYQHNPFGNTWGHMSWGHAVSKDLVHWEELPVAIPEAEDIAIFSGAAVYDKNNTSGLGTAANPPLVAIFTGWNKSTNNQSQYIASSTDKGRTWTRYGTAPVLDIGSTESRDPKVFWHEPGKQWIMVFAKAKEHKVAIYGSKDLKNWNHLSDFGPYGSEGDVWEVPDLIQLPVDGDPTKKKWVMIVSVNGGSLYGGSGIQYFPGEFNGTTFTPDPLPVVSEPTGVVFADFEGPTYGDWVATGDAFGTGPAQGALPGQSPVTGFKGKGLVNTFLNFDQGTGTLTSPEFLINKPFITFLMGGGNHPGETAMNLLVDGKVVRSATGQDSEALRAKFFDVADLKGKKAKLQILDTHTGGWGHINVDHIMFTDAVVNEMEFKTLWADFGKDFYAGVTYDNLPTDEKIWIGWMSNWQYAGALPTYPWRNAQSIPRKLSLKTTPEGLRLAQEPIQALKTQRGVNFSAGNLPVSQVNERLKAAGVRGKTLEVLLEIDAKDAEALGLKLHKSSAEQTVITYNRAAERISVDRTQAGEGSFSNGFPEVHAAPLKNVGDTLTLHVILDTSSIEVFAEDGRVVFSDLTLSSPSSDGIELFSTGGDPVVRKLEVFELKSIWKK